MQRRSGLPRGGRLATLAIGAALLAACGGAAAPASPGSASTSVAAAKPSAAPAPASVAAQPSRAESSAPKPAASGLAKVRYGELRILGDAGVYIALEQGFFAQQGIDLELTPFDSAVNMIPALGTGQLDVGGGAMSAGLWNAVARGVALKVVADKGHLDSKPPGFPIADLLVRKDLWDSGKVKSVADLKGLTIATPAKGFTGEITAAKELAKGSLTAGDVNYVTVPLTEIATAYANKKIDAGAAIEPFRTLIVDQQKTGVLLMHDYEVDSGAQTAGILYGPDFAKGPLAAPFVAAYLQGVRMYNDGFVKKDPAAREKSIDALIKHTAVKDRALFDKMATQGLDPNGGLNVKSLEEQQDFWVAHGEQQQKVDFGKVVDGQYVKAALAKLGDYKSF